MKTSVWKVLAAMSGAAAIAAGAPCYPADQPAAAPHLKGTPQGFEVVKGWPAEAGADIDSGMAAISCVVDVNGKLTDCTVKKEEPANRGFGAAALKFTPGLTNKVRKPGETTTATFLFARVYTDPEWLKKPTFDQLMATYPREAMIKGLGGKAMIKCFVNLQGLMRDCTILSETPADMGFGGAALALAPTFLMKPGTKNGQPFESEVSIPIAFQSKGPVSLQNTETVNVLPQVYWAKTPTTSEILAEIDKKVGDRFADGKVAMQCTIDRKSGHINSCVITNTSPGMAQFTGVARNLTSKFQVDPELLAAVKGNNKLVVNLAFSFPDMASSTWSERHLRHVQWKQTVSPNPTTELFPKAAADAGLKTGKATLDCRVGADGALTECKTVSESVPNVGFGAMAQRIAEVMIANPWTDEGLPADGAHVLLPIVMNEAPAAEPAAATK